MTKNKNNNKKEIIKIYNKLVLLEKLFDSRFEKLVKLMDIDKSSEEYVEFSDNFYGYDAINYRDCRTIEDLMDDYEK